MITIKGNCGLLIASLINCTRHPHPRVGCTQPKQLLVAALCHGTGELPLYVTVASTYFKNIFPKHKPFVEGHKFPLIMMIYL